VPVVTLLEVFVAVAEGVSAVAVAGLAVLFVGWSVDVLWLEVEFEV